ncbi:MAG: TIGR04076 family protein [Peptococcaceae bacterium]|nr:TIGR04076 family protein [Peptococcaceae bacterium]
MTELELAVKSVKGYCSAGLQAGHKFVFRDPLVVPEDRSPLCLYALSAMFPYLTAACRKTPAADWINSVAELQCPDSANTVVFAVRRRVSDSD